MEMNTRIPVEHPITEQVIDYDLINEQIKVAAGIPITGKNYNFVSPITIMLICCNLNT